MLLGTYIDRYKTFFDSLSILRLHTYSRARKNTSS